MKPSTYIIRVKVLSKIMKVLYISPLDLHIRLHRLPAEQLSSPLAAMRSNIAILLSALATAVTAGPCHANNCLRAVRATQFPTRLNDCATNLAVTYTPSTVTVTSTAQATTTVAPVIRRRALLDTDLRNPKLGERAAEAAALIERDAGGPAIPTYATACTDFAAYSSACSCAGATPATITVPAPVTSTTVTATPRSRRILFQGCRNMRGQRRAPSRTTSPRLSPT
ncbi:hypothetical protein MAPG_01316 [Magnaporthiopsis poae ATCC 64411]|uniref:Uncharacterized protein n=1 Tax=Magnaporthiopsis poae (strain ATCC 64411 / 73-15) TaxID=644358 RepID=A0A0C4DND5_MAGP6|nr:hypothetical protein MAPG_01316 [Magnaporthiopsis poae ATCC 64411]